MIKAIFRLAIVVSLALPLVNCASNKSSPPDSGSNSAASTTTPNPLDTAILTPLVNGFYKDILGRAPTPAELANAIAMLQAGLSNQQLQQALANGAESIWNITQQLLAHGITGTTLETVLNQWITKLGNGQTLQQLLATLTGSV